MNQPQGELKRELGIPGAVITGLGSILGTGVFVSIGIAAGVAGESVALAIVAAALVAICNGLSSAQLAANHPVSGGTYEYGYRWLNPTLGFTAGWMFLWAKSASAATAALGFAGYLLPLSGRDVRFLIVPVALLGLVVLTVVVLWGIRRTAQVNALIVGTTVLVLVAFIVMGNVSPSIRPIALSNLWPAGDGYASFAQAIGLMFVAYTGYGRIATLGEEVKSPRRTIPIAVIVTLAVSMLLYFLVAVTALRNVDAETFAQYANQDAAPLEMVAQGFEVPGAAALMTLGAVTAMLGVLLNLLLGLSRVLLAMGRRGDMPHGLALVSQSSGVPWTATIAIAVLIGAIICVGSVKLAWSFSAFTVLIYYAITNACALRLKAEERLYPRIIPVLGLVSCLTLSFWVDRQVWLFGVGLLVMGIVWHLVARRLTRGASTT
ncbi:putative amino acid permease YhdG [Bremerella volcania]|uniref:Putative amino acid permease YhdG n=1 Tax=Bremerella volcania TaxID=2527984 RepID=A0A518C912_9BACT|nr:APC family permease [Bremerella volcania]QDU75709.1 putative amino acid permease YhdG [Bremerella volcania]